MCRGSGAIGSDPPAWAERLARIGFAARGAVFGTIGLLAMRAASAGRAQEVAGPSGALLAMLRQPLGAVLLAMVALGLAAYGVWSLVRAVLNPDREPHTPVGYVNRTGFLLSAAGHGLLAYTALRILVPWDGGAGSGVAWLTWIMSHAAGRFAVGAVGAAVVVQGAVALYRAIAGEPTARMDLAGMPPPARRWTDHAVRLGEAAKALVYCVVGTLLIRAAQRIDPASAGGMEGALEWLLWRPFGRWLLGAVGTGLLLYAIGEALRVRLHRVEALRPPART